MGTAFVCALTATRGSDELKRSFAPSSCTSSNRTGSKDNELNVIRTFLLTAFLLLGGNTLAQEAGSSDDEKGSPRNLNLFRDVRPDATIVVRKHEVGVDLVTITMDRADFPPELLRGRIENLAERLGSPLNALRVYAENLGGDPKFKVVRGSFGVRGLIDREKQTFNLEPLARAFAGIPAPNEIDVLMVQFEGEQPGPNTLKTFSNDSIQLQAEASAPLGVEYRVRMLTQDPERISIPKERAPAAPAAVVPPRQGPDRGLIVLIVAAALAGGALVYSLLLRSRPSRRP